MEPMATALTRLLAERRMSQTELWVAAGVSPAVVSYYVNGKRGSRINSQAAPVIERIAAVLGVPPDYFVEWRCWRVQEITRQHPQLADEVYDLLVAHAAAEDERQTSRRSKGR